MTIVTIAIFLLIVLSVSNGKPTFDKKCPIDTIDFATKVDNSPVVVYGKTTAKVLYNDSDPMFYAIFQVNCILKGPPTARQINITRAGRVENRTYCQRLSVGDGYTIAFLEPNSHDTKFFTPADFVEVHVESNSTDELLANTCNLRNSLPINSSDTIADACPVVSINRQCVSTTMIPHFELTSISLLPVVIPGESQHDMDQIRGKSGTISVDTDRKNAANPIYISIIFIFMAISLLAMN